MSTPFAVHALRSRTSWLSTVIWTSFFSDCWGGPSLGPRTVHVSLGITETKTSALTYRFDTAEDVASLESLPLFICEVPGNPDATQVLCQFLVDSCFDFAELCRGEPRQLLEDALKREAAQWFSPLWGLFKTYDKSAPIAKMSVA